MSRLGVDLGKLKLSNPIILASGTCNFGQEYAEFFPLSKLGGLALKGTTLLERKGNPPPRVAEVYGGIINSVGLQNPGFTAFSTIHLPLLKDCGCALIANIAGSTEQEYIELGTLVNDCPVDGVELNISCPNVKEGGLSFGRDALSVADIVDKFRKVCHKPLIVKLSPNTADIGANATAAAEQGADIISLINTVSAMAIDYKSRRPILGNITGGLSGPAIKPIALNMVYTVHQKVDIPIIGMGGIASWQDVVEFMLAGASAVQIGTASMVSPMLPLQVIEGLEQYTINEGLSNISEIVGALEV